MIFSDKYNLIGKTAIITGGLGLLGIQHALALLKQGANVILTDIISDHQKMIHKLKNKYLDQTVECITMDVTSETSIQHVLDKVLIKLNKIDILINNAAINPQVLQNKLSENNHRLENFRLDSWNQEVSIGLTGAFLCAKHIGNHMANSRGGIILNIASDLSVIAPDQRIYRKRGIADAQQPVKPVTYSVIKHGLIGLTKYLATYWADSHVRVNALSPGGIYHQQPKDFTDKLKPLIPMGRMANIDEYHGAIQFLCSEASSYMTGQNIIIDGGRSVW